MGGGGAGRNFWSSSATVFFSHRPFSVFGRKHEQETPQSPDCSLIIPSNEREGARRKTHANCTSSTQPAYGVEPQGWKNPYGTIKLIVSSPFFSVFFPLQGAFVLLTSPAKGGMGTKKKRRRRRRQRNGPGISGGAVNTHFCASAEASWEKKSKRDKRSRWMAGRSGGVKGEGDSARLTKAGGGGGGEGWGQGVAGRCE